MNNNITPAICGQAVCGQTICGQTALYNEKSKATAELGENPKVNLATGRLLYVQPDLSIGSNNYEINVSHVYTSTLGDKITGKFPGTGYGWKLNVQQYVEKLDDSRYIYVDETGYVHDYVLFDTANKRYYDTLDAGMVLTAATGAEVQISDGIGNRMYFNDAGQIRRIVSGHNDKISKVYSYDSSGRVNKICDERHQSGSYIKEWLGFAYDSAGMLKSVIAYDHGTKKINGIDFGYTGNKLVKTTKVVYGENGQPFTTKTGSEFVYSAAGLLTAVIDAETRSAIKVEYNTDSTVNRLSRGVLKAQSAYAGAKGISGNQLNYAGQIFAGLSDVATFDKSFVKKSSILFGYNFITVGGINYSNQTNVTNDKMITLTYFVDTKMRITSSFEVNDGYRTLEKESAKKIAVKADGTSKINGATTARISSSIPYKPACNNMEISRSNAERTFVYYSCSFWLKHMETADRLKVKVEYSFRRGTSASAAVVSTSTSEVNINAYAYNVWQKVTVPIIAPEIDYTETNYKNFLSSISISVLNVDNTNTSECQISSLIFAPSPNVKTYLEKYNGTTTLRQDIQNATTVYLIPLSGNATTFNSKTSKTMFMTDNDVIRSISNKYTQPLNPGGLIEYYDVILNDGTKRIPNIIDIRIDSTSNTTDFDYMHRAKVRTPDYKCETDQAYKPRKANNNIFVETRVTGYPRGIGYSFESESYAYAYYDYKGKKQSESDEYGIKTEYDYDNYGNLVCTTVIGSDGTRKIVNETYYDDKSETATTIQIGHASADYTYSSPFGLVEETYLNNYNSVNGFFNRSNNKTTSLYDLYKEKIISAKKFKGEDIENQTTLTYENGAVRTVSDARVKYGIINDELNNKVMYTQFSTATSHIENAILTQTLTEISGNETVESIYSVGSGNNDSIKSTTDKYGRPDNVAVNSVEKSKYTYQAGIESEVARLLDTYRDNFEEKTIFYFYDSDGNLAKWRKGTDHLAVQQIDPSKTLYTFGNEQSSTDKVYVSIIRDSSKLINPRTSKTISTLNENTGTYAFTTKYDYDGYGRLSKKAFEIQTYAPDDSCEISYDSKTGFPQAYDYYFMRSLTNLSTYKTDRYYTQIKNSSQYDDKGNITHSDETWYTYQEQTPGNGQFSYVEGSASTTTHTKSYSYDNQSRLTSEVNSALGINRTYSYGSNGKLISIGGTNGKTLEYYGVDDGIHNGRLKKYGTTVCTYDTYGNRISKTGASYTYTRGNLLASVDSAVYSYNMQGQRYQKVSGGITTTYYLDGDKILGEDRSDGKKLRFIYDTEGLAGFRYQSGSSTPIYYRYVKNAQGDIVAIMTSGAGATTSYGATVVARYKYDVWGNCSVESIGTTGMGSVNPFRWKGHYFDSESSMYMISNGSRARYYDPGIGLYVDADDIENVLIKASIPDGLDRHSLMCDNVNDLIPYLATILTMYNLMPDPNANSNINESGWEMPNWLKWTIGLGLFVGAVVLTIISGGTLGAVVSLFVGMGIGIALGGFIDGTISALSGGNFSEGFADGAADGAFWGGIFTFVSAGIQAIKYFSLPKFERLAIKYTHNVRADKVMLGKYDGGGPTSYITKAGKKYTYFSMPDKTWIKLETRYGKDFMWKINEAFLKQQSAKAFFSSHAITTAVVDTSFWKEIQFLLSKGILVS